MVQLKVGLHHSAPNQIICFNSIMVQLKEKMKERELLLELFQFHHGTIKSLRALLLLSSPLRFNSIMVQLKGTGGPALLEAIAQFQFHHGTIKR